MPRKRKVDIRTKLSKQLGLKAEILVRLQSCRPSYNLINYLMIMIDAVNDDNDNIIIMLSFVTLSYVIT